MTVLDGNSLRRTLRSEKHRVATINAGGCIENCLIRNGHARGATNTTTDKSGHGGGILLNGGKIYNCIIRGNVAMNVQYKSSNPGKGGGIYIVSGEAVNCIVAFNMDDNGAGIDGDGGNVINCTVARNSNTPTYVRIASGVYQPFNGENTTNLITNRYVYLDSFYIASTETTGGQYACFMAAIDYYDGGASPYLKGDDVNAIKSAKMPTEVDYTGYSGGITVADYVIFDGSSTNGCATPGSSCWNLLSNQPDLRYGGVLTTNSSGVVWYPNTDVSGGTTTTGEDKKRDNYAISCVTWYGSIAFCLWLGGSLPTEAQWEYAGRYDGSGANNSYMYAGSGTLDDVAWYNGNSGTGGDITTRHAHEVGKKASTSAGLYDMSGNMYEWCIDEYGSYLNTGSLTVASGKNLVSADMDNTGATSGAPLRNPIACTGSHRVRRGGDWNTSAAYCSLGYRYDYTPSYVGSFLGFRGVGCP
jgi:formylglycine-generating enzyme required for sulfatase activity